MTLLISRIRSSLEDFAAHLVNARKQAQLTQTQLAAAAGLTASYLSFIENRKKPPPSDEVCRRLAKALGMPAEDLLERAHLQRAPKELRARVQDLTSSLHRERSSARSFLEGLLSPFLFSGPPGYADGAMDVLAISPARRRRIRDAAKRTGDERARRKGEIRRLLDDLSDDELRDLATRMPHWIEDQPPHDPPVLDAEPSPDDAASGRHFILVLRSVQLGSLAFPAAGAHVLIDPTAKPEPGDLLLLRAGDHAIVRRLVLDGGLYRLAGGDPEQPMPAEEMFARLDLELCGVLTELRTPLRKRDG